MRALKKKYGDEIAQQQVNSLFFLRYANPLLMNPQGFAEEDGDPTNLDPTQKENLVLVGKVLQNFANNVPMQGGKENYLGFMDKNFIDKNQDQKAVLFQNLIR